MRTTQQSTNLLHHADRSESPVRHRMLVSPSIIEIYNLLLFLARHGRGRRVSAIILCVGCVSPYRRLHPPPPPNHHNIIVHQLYFVTMEHLIGDRISAAIGAESECIGQVEMDDVIVSTNHYNMHHYLFILIIIIINVKLICPLFAVQYIRMISKQKCLHSFG